MAEYKRVSEDVDRALDIWILVNFLPAEFIESILDIEIASYRMPADGVGDGRPTESRITLMRVLDVGRRSRFKKLTLKSTKSPR